MDNNIVKAFRLRLRRAGFSRIHIGSTFYPDVFWVACFRDGVDYSATLSLSKMAVLPRSVFFEKELK